MSVPCPCCGAAAADAGAEAGTDDAVAVDAWKEDIARVTASVATAATSRAKLVGDNVTGPVIGTSDVVGAFGVLLKVKGAEELRAMDGVATEPVGTPAFILLLFSRSASAAPADVAKGDGVIFASQRAGGRRYWCD